MKNSLLCFFFLPLITDLEEKINEHRDNVNLNPIDCSLDCLNSFSPDKEVSFRPDLLNSADAELRRPQVELPYQFFRQMAEISNANLIRNADICLLQTIRITATLFVLDLPSNDLKLPNSS